MRGGVIGVWDVVRDVWCVVRGGLRGGMVRGALCGVAYDVLRGVGYAVVRWFGAGCSVCWGVALCGTECGFVVRCR